MPCVGHLLLLQRFSKLVVCTCMYFLFIRFYQKYFVSVNHIKEARQVGLKSTFVFSSSCFLLGKEIRKAEQSCKAAVIFQIRLGYSKPPIVFEALLLAICVGYTPPLCRAWPGRWRSSGSCRRTPPACSSGSSRPGSHPASCNTTQVQCRFH